MRSLKAWRVRRSRNTGCAGGRGLCFWRRRHGQPRDWPASWLHHRHGLEVAGALCARPARGLSETGNRGAAPKYTAATEQRILAVLDRPVPAGHGRWTGPLIAAELGDVDVQSVWRFLRAQKIALAARKSWCESHDPAFAAKAAEIVGLYLDPPDGALVLAVDEKPSIQALEQAQGYLKLPNGRALTGQSHNYKRHGTTTLFAALDIATGEVRAKHNSRRRRIEFLDFMNRIVAEHPERHIHVILDNLNTHKPKNDRWLNQIG